MRLTRLSKLAVAAALAVTLLPSAAAVAADPAPGPVLSGSVPSAQQALAAVQAAFGQGPSQGAERRGSEAATRPAVRGRELTLAMRALRLQLGDLSPGDRDIARSYLARPTQTGEPFGASYGSTARPRKDCSSSYFCIFWARRTADAPPLADRDRDGVPNQVEKTRNVMNQVWDRIIRQGGYVAPPGDQHRGGSNKFDVYLVDIGGQGLYGYCSPEGFAQGSSMAAFSYCVLDEDFSRAQFPSHTPLQNLRVTGAHEFFHAVQFSYDVWEDTYLLENTATWIEDEIYDAIDDNRQFLASSSLQLPWLALDDDRLRYGNWIWWRYLTERFPASAGGLPVLVRDVWENARSTYSMDATEQTLADLGFDLAELLADFGVANRRPGTTYSEGAAYRTSSLYDAWNLSASRRNVDPPSFGTRHLATHTIAFRPVADFEQANWFLDLDVDLPDLVEEPVAHVTVIPLSGDPVTTEITLDSSGDGSLEVPFTSSTVRRVELTLTNGGHDYVCDVNGEFSCMGAALDDGQPFDYRASTFQTS